MLVEMAHPLLFQPPAANPQPLTIPYNEIVDASKASHNFILQWSLCVECKRFLQLDWQKQNDDGEQSEVL